MLPLAHAYPIRPAAARFRPDRAESDRRVQPWGAPRTHVARMWCSEIASPESRSSSDGTNTSRITNFISVTPTTTLVFRQLQYSPNPSQRLCNPEPDLLHPILRHRRHIRITEIIH